MAWEITSGNSPSPHYSNEKNAELEKQQKDQQERVRQTQMANMQNKGLADSAGNVVAQDELGRIYNPTAMKWEKPGASVTNEGGAGGGAISGGYYSSSRTSSSTYNPVNQDDYMKNVLSYDDALTMAKQALTPQYQLQYEKSAAQAAQNLGASGLYDSVYGQALSAEAQRDIDRDLEAAIQQLALSLQGNSRDEALALLQLAVGENQFGANFNQSAYLEDRAYNERMLDRTIAQANADRDYALAQQAQDLKNRVQNYYETQGNWQMGGFDSQFQMQQALYEMEQKSSKNSGGGGSPKDIDLSVDRQTVSHSTGAKNPNYEANRAAYTMAQDLQYIWGQTGKNTTNFRAVAEQAGYSNAQITSFLANQTY